MKTYRFTVYLRGVDVMTDDIANKLFAVGCDDCSPGSHSGEAFAAFDRESDSLEAAVASAADNIRCAGYSIDRVQIDASELAELAQ